MHDITLAKFSSLIRHDAHLAKERMNRVIIHMNNFAAGDWTKFSEFYHEVHHLLTSLENIKVYVQREEKAQLDSLHLFLQDFLNEQFSLKVSASMKKKIIKQLNVALARIIADLKMEGENEKKVVLGSKPKISFFKNTSIKRLDKQIARDAAIEHSVIKANHHYSDELLHEAHEIAIGAKASTDKLEHEVRMFVLGMRKEFDVFLEEKVDVELQENDLLNWLLKLQERTPQRKNELQDLIDLIRSRIKEDIKVALTLRNEAIEIKKGLKRVA
jgi:hypothetical protein